MKRYRINEQVDVAINTISRRVNGESVVTGAETGFTDIDYMTHGLNKGEVTIIAGRPSMGKTSVALNMINQIALKDKKNVLFISQENNASSVVTRLLSINAKVEAMKIHKGDLDEIEFDSVISSADRISKSSLIICDDCYDIETVKKTIKKINKEKPIDVVFIDYLQLIGVSSEECLNREDEVKKIMKIFKKLAKKMGISIVVLSQLSRKIEERENHRPNINDFEVLKKSLKYADKILMLYRDEYYNKDTDRKGLMEIHIVKNNVGNKGCIELAWLREYCILANLERVF